VSDKMAAINRIVFMGTPEFALPSLQALLTKDENVVCVVTQPDRPRGRGRKIQPPPVKILADRQALPVLQPESIKAEEFIAHLKQFEPDVIVVTAFGKILPPAIINLPPLGTINVHGSLLPKYRGAAPIQWAIINGETETGVTIMQMDEGIDTGDILLQEKLPIEKTDTAGSMSEKLAALGGKTLARALDLLRRNKLQPARQDNSKASLAPILKKQDGLIHWSQSAEHLSCLIRGLDPWPAAYTTLAGRRLKLYSPEIAENKNCPDSKAKPGAVCRADRAGLLVATGKGCLLITEIQAEAAKRMAAAAYISGNPVQAGTVLGQ
jgi:methionyl-tRNA formyltransferase